MASERQIAANRRNAQKSTGPRTAAGKTRARQNAYRHGFRAVALFSLAAEEHMATLAQAIAGDHDDSPLVHHWASNAADAMLGLARLRRLKAAAMNEIEAGRLSPTAREPRASTTSDSMLERVLRQIPGTGRLVDVRFRFPRTVSGDPGLEVASSWIVTSGRRNIALLGFQEVHRHFRIWTLEFDMYFIPWPKPLGG